MRMEVLTEPQYSHVGVLQHCMFNLVLSLVRLRSPGRGDEHMSEHTCEGNYREDDSPVEKGLS